MAVLSVQGLSKSFGTTEIFSNINFLVNENDIIGLIGQNGAGKTTLFKVLTSQLSYDEGTITVGKDVKLGCFEQLPDYGESTIYGYCLDCYSHVFDLIGRQKELESDISAYGARSENPPQSMMDEYSELLFKLDEMNAYAYDSEIKGTLKGLGFKDNEFEKEANCLSGGEKSRLNLARLLLTKPDVYLLDEPTNHLDMKSVSWLESYIKKSGKAFIIVSHDRFFLDQIVTKVMELENGNLLQNTGNYTNFVSFKESVYETLIREYEKALTDYERQEDIVRRMKQHGTEKLAKRAKSREKLLEKIDIPDRPFRLNEQAKLTLKSRKSTGYDVIHADSLVKSYPGKVILDGIGFDVYQGDRIGIIGPNGAGKTTLLNALCGKIDFEGSVSLGQGVEIGYYDQNLVPINESNDLIEEISDEFPGFDTTKIRTLLGAFLFKGDEVFKEMKKLSGGERARVSLLRLMLRGSNLLFLDEPTNHLDINSREVLENALLNYDGTIMTISHDRYFLNRVCNRMFHLEGGRITEFHGNYDYYLEKIAEAQELDEGSPSTASKQQVTKTQLKDDRRKEKEKQTEARKAKQRQAKIEDDIHKLEAKVTELESLLCEESVFSDYEKANAIHAEIESIKANLEDLYANWEEFIS